MKTAIKAFFITLIGLLVVGGLIFVTMNYLIKDNEKKEEKTTESASGITDKVSGLDSDNTALLASGEAIEEASPDTAEEATPADAVAEEDTGIFGYPEIDFEPHAVESTQPTNLLVSTEIAVDGTVLEDKSQYASTYSLGDIEFAWKQFP